MLLQVVAFSTNVRGDLKSIGKTDSTYFTQCRVGFLRGSGVDTRTNSTPLRTSLQCWNATLHHLSLARLAHKLIDGCHSKAPKKSEGFPPETKSAHSIDAPTSFQLPIEPTVSGQ